MRILSLLSKHIYTGKTVTGHDIPLFQHESLVRGGKGTELNKAVLQEMFMAGNPAVAVEPEVNIFQNGQTFIDEVGEKWHDFCHTAKWGWIPIGRSDIRYHKVGDNLVVDRGKIGELQCLDQYLQPATNVLESLGLTNSAMFGLSSKPLKILSGLKIHHLKPKESKTFDFIHAHKDGTQLSLFLPGGVVFANGGLLREQGLTLIHNKQEHNAWDNPEDNYILITPQKLNKKVFGKQAKIPATEHRARFTKQQKLQINKDGLRIMPVVVA